VDPDEHEEPQFIPVAKMTTGRSFGELALINNKPRAATIQCITACHFAYMSKHDYHRSLIKIEQKKMNKIIDFFLKLPYFSHWTKTSVAKLQYSFELKTFNQGHIVFHEGSKASSVYIIKSGDFEVSRTVKLFQKKELNIKEYLGPKDKFKLKSGKAELNSKIEALSNVRSLSNNLGKSFSFKVKNPLS
jgi:CRP-like cAMP-binding protein